MANSRLRQCIRPTGGASWLLALMESARTGPHNAGGHDSTGFSSGWRCADRRLGHHSKSILAIRRRAVFYATRAGYGWYTSSLVSTFQQIRTILLASATTAT